jgi:hypothetical protein
MVWKEYRPNAANVLIRYSDKVKSWTTEESGFGFRLEQPIFLFFTKSDLFLGPPILLYSVCLGCLLPFSPVTGGWRKHHDEELHNFHSSRSIIRTMKSRRIRWAEHVAQIEGVHKGFW